jgi:hypothetical protein
LTSGLLRSARDTVACDTCAIRAMSFEVGREVFITCSEDLVTDPRVAGGTPPVGPEAHSMLHILAPSPGHVSICCHAATKWMPSAGRELPAGSPGTTGSI